MTRWIKCTFYRHEDPCSAERTYNPYGGGGVGESLELPASPWTLDGRPQVPCEVETLRRKAVELLQVHTRHKDPNPRTHTHTSITHM